MEALLAAFENTADVYVLLMMLVGIVVGLLIGVIPGLGGLATLALLLPFAYGMEAAPALALIIGAYSALYFGGSISAILLNTPGTGEQVVTAMDGYPMSRQGMGARAIGASATSTALGGVFGACLMLATIPFIRTIIVYVRPPEMFVLSLIGVAAIGVVSSSKVSKGILAGLLGLILSFIGYDPINGIPRYTFGQLTLYDGLGVTAMTLGLFAIGEMIFLFTRGKAIADASQFEMSREQGRSVLDGVKDTFRNIRTVFEGGAIGALVGVIPGLGGTVAMFFSYARARQRSKDPESFGKGNVIGVIAAEAAANAKESGSFVPTIAFGIPGSSGMAIFIGIFLILGLAPGREMLTVNLHVTYYIAIVIALTSVGASAIGLILAMPMARIAHVRPEILAPVIIAVSVVGSYIRPQLFTAVLIAFAAGVFGYFLKILGYSRAGVILGFIMGPLVERYLFLSIQAYGPGFMLRPLTILTLVLGVLFVSGPYLRRQFDSFRRRLAA